MNPIDYLKLEMEWTAPGPDCRLVKTCGAAGDDLWMALVYERDGLFHAAAAPFGDGEPVMSPIPQASVDLAEAAAFQIAESAGKE